MKKVYLIAVIVAIIAGFSTYLFATKIEEKTTIKDAPSLNVVVALVDIPENTIITEEMVTSKNIVESAVTPNAITNLEDVIGKATRYPVVQGEQLLESRFSTLGEENKDNKLAYELKSGEYAYTLPVSEETATSFFIKPGDYVDIIYSYTNDSDKTESKYLYENIKVLKTSNYEANKAANDSAEAEIKTYGSVVLLLNKDQIIELTSATKNGSIKLVLKSVLENQQETTVAAE